MPCQFCGGPIFTGDRFCRRCGGRVRSEASEAPLGPRYTGLRFQIDPIWPPPRRDVRWILIVLGAALTVLGVLLVAVGALVSSAIGLGSSGCPTASCAAADPGVWITWMGLPILVTGLAFLVLGVWWAIR